MRILIICRGPIRKEAIEVFREMGVARVGILLSEKDSIVYTNALAPELRMMAPSDVHRVKDYTGVHREERTQRIQQIIRLCKTEGYGYIFAGYGFMAEDEALVEAIEEAGLRFVGPCSRTVRAAGRKDEAKRTALEQKVSVTPGVQNLTGRTLLAAHPTVDSLRDLIRSAELDVATSAFDESKGSLETLAEAVLEASYRKGIDIISTDQISEQLKVELAQLFEAHPGRRIRLKAIGGGGGKGQRILQGPSASQLVPQAVEKAPEKYREILAEVKAGGVGDNKNVLLELNIESTRHHEIQLLGNGEWCIALGGRDCSLQMHEQKLLEISLTQEALREEIQRAAHSARASAIGGELEVLARMEGEAERFGRAVGLDSASTFECIVDGNQHYFMEVNTRIQVEHRVSELCYGLRFSSPEGEPKATFEVTSIVEAMALIARHKERLPRPDRVPREMASVEARLNATDRSLHPSAGGIIEYWSDPIDGEVRDEQGICLKNPDTNQFVRYRLAGAYDSNIALLVAVGARREAAYEKLQEILRCTHLDGPELATNLEFHQGLVGFFLGTSVYAKPTTRFVAAYVAQVGLLKAEVEKLDVGYAGKLILKKYEHDYQAQGDEAKGALAAVRAVFERKRTLLERPLNQLIAEPHLLSAWLSALRGEYEVVGDQVRWNTNPIHALRHTYCVLNMDRHEDGAAEAAEVIWAQDQAILESAIAFYEELEERLELKGQSWAQLEKILSQVEPPDAFDASMWANIRGAHIGFKAGLELFELLPLIAARAGFFDIKVNDRLEVEIPEALLDAELQARMRKVLVPPPVASGDEIVAVTGGMFYARESPDRPPMVEVGQHVEVGDPLYIIEVMKMFNRVSATFSGTIEKICIDTDGAIVRKGQTLFKIRPDVLLDEDNSQEEAERRRLYTEELVQRLTA